MSRPESSSIRTIVVPRTADIGGFEVRRALPSREVRTVGPFVFFDQMGPGEFLTSRGLDVRPHPHIGLATVTYLFHGRILHQDSLGTALPIEPGAVNWMTAGRGIAHSERTPTEDRAAPSSLFGIQAWVALPAELEETDPDFTHHAATSLPVVEGDGAVVRVITGDLFGAVSPVRAASQMVYADITLEAGARLPLDPVAEERALYLAAGRLRIGKDEHSAGRLLLLAPNDRLTVEALEPARLMFLGGAPLDGPRYLWWNFVSSRKDRIEAAKADWREGRFAQVPGDAEQIPLPER